MDKMTKTMRSMGVLRKVRLFFYKWVIYRPIRSLYALTDTNVLDVMIGASIERGEVSLLIVLKNGDKVNLCVEKSHMRKIAYRIRDVCDSMNVGEE